MRTTLTAADERVVVAVSLRARREHLREVAEALLARDDAACALLLAAGDTYSSAWRPAWGEVVAILDRRGGDPLQALDLVVELSQQAAVRGGEPRMWSWPPYQPR